MEDFIASGVDILNPVQFNAAGMDAAGLKRDFGGRLVFWGAGVDVQTTLPFGTPDQVRAEVRAHLRALAPGGGFVFGGVHNIQARVPTANLEAMHAEFAAWRKYPVRAAA